MTRTLLIHLPLAVALLIVSVITFASDWTWSQSAALGVLIANVVRLSDHLYVIALNTERR